MWKCYMEESGSYWMQRGKNEDQRVAQNQVPKGPFYMIAFALLNKLETLKCSISQYKLIHR